MIEENMKLKSLVAGVFACLSSIAVAGTADQELIGLLQKIDTFHAHFVQKIHDAKGEHVSKTQGDIIVRRPGKFYWKTQPPNAMLIVADGSFLWTYDIDLEQVTKQKMKEALGNSPATLLAGSVTQLSQSFAISYAKKGQCSKAADHCFMLHPKQKEAAIFSEIFIGFNQGKLVEVKMHDPLGQAVFTTFSNVQLNQNISPKVFAFVPPKGVDVIHGGN